MGQRLADDESVIDETRREIYPYGWEDIHVIGIDVPLFVNLDEARK